MLIEPVKLILLTSGQNLGNVKVVNAENLDWRHEIIIVKSASPALTIPKVMPTTVDASKPNPVELFIVAE
jgi:hypothetical protein